MPTGDDRFDWECEMAVIIGANLTDTAEADAMDGVLGYTCFNDISSRGYQRRTHQWAIGKNGDGSAPIGPVVVTAGCCWARVAALVEVVSSSSV